MNYFPIIELEKCLNKTFDIGYYDIEAILMRESSYTIDSLINEEYKTGSLFLNTEFILEINQPFFFLHKL